MSPWIRFVEIDGRAGHSRIVWLTTGDVISPYEEWPVCHVGIVCEECGARLGGPFLSPASPFFDGERLVWYCQIHVVTTPGLREMLDRGKTETEKELLNAYPRFNPWAAPGEEWIHE